MTVGVSKFILIADIERCPYVPKDAEYSSWTMKDDERLKNIAEARQKMWELTPSYFSHEDRNVRNMAHFIRWLFDRE